MYMYVLYLSFSTSDLLSFIISNTDKHEFSSIWKCIGCPNDVMIHVDCVIKRDVYPRKIHSCYGNICVLYIYFFFCSKNIRGISRKNIGVIAWIFR